MIQLQDIDALLGVLIQALNAAIHPAKLEVFIACFLGRQYR